MKILHISNSDSGGAANAMLMLHRSLINNGQNSQVLVLFKSVQDDTITNFLSGRNFLSHLKDSIKYRIFSLRRRYHRIRYKTDINFTYFDGPFSLENHPLYFWADIIHIHWYHNFINLKEALSKIDKPIVFTLHDENLFLGGFHYSYDKQISSISARKIDDKLLLLKTRIIKANRKIHFIAPSKWLFDLLKKNYFEHKHQIPYAIDSGKFKIVEKIIAREKLGINCSNKVYLLLADHLSSKRKGIFKTLKVFKEQCDPDMLLVIAGNTNKMINHEQIKYLGYINGSEKLSYVYSSADVLINPTLADNLPNTVLESLVCGTPVIGFNTGGMHDMINKTNGVLLKPGDFEGIFNNQIFNALKKINPILISSNCVKNFSIENQVLRHKKLYKSLTQFN